MGKKKAKPNPVGRPPTGQTPKRYFRMDDDAYAQVVRASEKAGQTASDFIREALLKAAKRREGESNPTT